MARDPLGEQHGDEEFDANLEGAGGLPMEGEFLVRLSNITKSISKAGNEMWVFDFTVISDMKGDDTHGGRDMPVYCAITPDALWKLEETAVALGLCEPGGQLSFKRSQAIGIMAVAVVEMGEFNGRKRPQISVIGPHPRGAGYRGETRAANPVTRPATSAPGGAPRTGGPPPARPVAQPAKPAARPAPAQPAARPAAVRPAPAKRQPEPEPEPEPTEDAWADTEDTSDEMPV